MSTLNRQFLESIGIVLDDQAFSQFNEHFEVTLEERIMESIVDELNEQQLRELSELRGGDDEQLQQWLRLNITDIDEIIQDEIDILLGELAENSEQINESTS